MQDIQIIFWFFYIVSKYGSCNFTKLTWSGIYVLCLFRIVLLLIVSYYNLNFLFFQTRLKICKRLQIPDCCTLLSWMHRRVQKNAISWTNLYWTNTLVKEVWENVRNIKVAGKGGKEGAKVDKKVFNFCLDFFLSKTESIITCILWWDIWST